MGFVQVLRADASRAEILSRALADRAPFDAVLLDAPCMNTGVLRRRPDARWRFSLPRLRELNLLQERLLTVASTWVRPGGRMVYSTCSLEPEENERLINEWCVRHTRFRVVTVERRMPPGSKTDGAFAALLCRTEH
jgi:16S rRNA (cytosine967-C5)-methyltransferase